MRTVTYSSGSIIDAPAEFVPCLWSNWEIYDAILHKPFRITATSSSSWSAEYYFRPCLTLEDRDAGLDAGRFVFSLRANILGLPSSTVVVLRYERLVSGSTSVHGEFRSDLGLVAQAIEPLVRSRMNTAVNDAITGGKTACEALSRDFAGVAKRLPPAFSERILQYVDCADRLRKGLPADSALLTPLPTRPPRPKDTQRIFVVHGRSERHLAALSSLLERHGCEIVILREQPNVGRTLIEKFEEHADTEYAVVLLTADDRGGLIGGRGTRNRARQNVVFEMGFFIGRLTRGRVCALYQDGVELPSDLHGITYVPLDDRGQWEAELLKELRAVGFKLRP